MATQVFVISDLHLGGAPGFQMCSPAGRKLLAEFVRSVTALHLPGLDAHLVIAGDAVDFLAEDPSSAFTADEAEAVRKLDLIFEHSAEPWAALAAHVAAGAPLTVLVGNHDIELSLPAVRRRLLQRLGVGRVELLYDDEAFALGPLLVEHGNRYDDWNWVNHDQLRHARRELSRGGKADFFEAQPGSQFVIQVMNHIKRDYPWVDLLKPEDSTVPPLLAVLRPDLAGIIRDVGGTAKHWIQMKLRAWGSSADGDSTRDAATEAAQIAEAMRPTERRLELASALARSDDEWLAAQAVGDGTRGAGLLGLILSRKDLTKDRKAFLGKLREALRVRLGNAAAAFDVNREARSYSEAAQRSIDRGFKVVVYGHTHLVKRVELSGGRYLNTGTWADLMRLPTSVADDSADEETALRELGEFADDLRNKAKIERWRCQVPTFARIELGDDLSLRSADVYRFRPGKALLETRVPDGQLEFDRATTEPAGATERLPSSI